MSYSPNPWISAWVIFLALVTLLLGLCEPVRLGRADAAVRGEVITLTPADAGVGELHARRTSE